jgi:TonB family protein
MTLLVQPGISVNIEAPSIEGARELRTVAAPLTFERACVTGRLLDKQDERSSARFEIGPAANIARDGPGPPEWLRADIYTACDNQVTAPTVKYYGYPHYTMDAMRKRIQGVALVQAIVDSRGRVERTRLLKGLDAKYGLDEEALKAAKSWTFKPGSKDGSPVRMAIIIELSFTLKQ